MGKKGSKPEKKNTGGSKRNPLSDSTPVVTTTNNNTTDTPQKQDANVGHFDVALKLLLVGDLGIGKSSLLLRFVDNTFVEQTMTTIGVDFKVRIVKVDNQQVKLQIWDTGGQEKTGSVSSSFFRGANGVIIVYDITNRESFQSVNKWLTEADRYAGDKTIKCLIGNKSDLSAQRKVSESDAFSLAEQLNLWFIETSALNSTNVEEAFMKMAKLMKDRNQDIEDST